ncbi:MAG TPA: hypothetical protein VK249_27905 [Anaerolineales bacterium]|nr:hypothetical protein [Anaerolineales bacterium]
MKHINHLFIVLLLIVGIQLSACASKAEATKKVDPAKLEPIEGTDFQRVILTEKAAARLNVQTALVAGNTIPYAAVIYDTEGNTWVYTNPEPLTFVRQAIMIDHIDGDQAILSQKLDSDTMVVTLGVSELYGAETGVSK